MNDTVQTYHRLQNMLNKVDKYLNGNGNLFFDRLINHILRGIQQGAATYSVASSHLIFSVTSFTSSW